MSLARKLVSGGVLCFQDGRSCVSPRTYSCTSSDGFLFVLSNQNIRISRGEIAKC